MIGRERTCFVLEYHGDEIWEEIGSARSYNPEDAMMWALLVYSHWWTNYPESVPEEDVLQEAA